MGPGPASSSRRVRQGERRRPRRGRDPSTRQRRRPRKRKCLLKGCEQWFVPGHHSELYCGPGCRRAAKRWSRWKYRQKKEAKALRSRQCQRRRARKKDEEKAVSSAGAGGKGAGEGHRVKVPLGFFSCDRSGCYEVRERSRRSPKQRFCSSGCHHAMRRVLVRERRWREGALRSGPEGSRRVLRC
jgi:hypothetical protein